MGIHNNTEVKQTASRYTKAEELLKLSFIQDDLIYVRSWIDVEATLCTLHWQAVTTPVSYALTFENGGSVELTPNQTVRLETETTTVQSLKVGDSLLFGGGKQLTLTSKVRKEVAVSDTSAYPFVDFSVPIVLNYLVKCGDDDLILVSA